MSEKDREAVEALYASLCACGQIKRRKMAFCSECYWRLPERLRKALWRRVEDGFGCAYRNAAAWLREFRAEDAENAEKGKDDRGQ